MARAASCGQSVAVKTSGVHHALAAAGDLVLPRSCAGCDAPGASVCAHCRAELADLALADLGPIAPSPVPPGWPGCTGTVRYEGLSARLARAFKDGERRDLVGVLGRLLADSVSRAVPSGPPVTSKLLIVPVPSSPAATRRRGDRPTLLLARRAANGLGPAVLVESGLRMRRGTADQATLDRTARLANLSGAMWVPRPDRLQGHRCVLVDDVLTSGATLTEGRRALLAAGAARVDLAVAMVTPRRCPR